MAHNDRTTHVRIAAVALQASRCALVWFSLLVAATSFLTTRTQAGGFAPGEMARLPQTVSLAEFRAPSAVSLLATSLPQTVVTARGFRAPEAGPDDEVAAEFVGSPVVGPELPALEPPTPAFPLLGSLPPRGPLDIELMSSELADPTLGAGSLSGNLSTSFSAAAPVKPVEPAGPLFTLPADIMRLPPLGDMSLPIVSLPIESVSKLSDPMLSDPTLASTAAEPSEEGARDAASAEPVSTAGAPDTAPTPELVPTPDANSDGEIVEVEAEEEVVETFGWSYLGMWLGERLTPNRIEAGGTFTSGTRRSWSALLKANWKVKEERYDDELTVNGTLTEVDRERSNNEWIVRDTFDWKAPDDSPWRLFIKGHAEYDEIEKLRFRGTASTGIGYAWINEEDRELTTRIGPSYTYEKFFDPTATNDKPEMLWEADFKWTFFDTMVLEHQVSAYPAFLERDGVRINDETGLLTPIGTSPFWSWKLGLRHQYNNQPNAAVSRNEFQASFLLVYDR